MHRTLILERLHGHQAWDAEEARMCTQIITFVQANRNCFERTNLTGHITGAAWILNETGEEVLMMHHRKLGMWLQPGGHSDGDPDTAAVGLREAQEETGLQSLRLESGELFDVDVHGIPARKQEPAHLHYDLRFVIRADREEPLRPNSESIDLKWIPLREVYQYNEHRSILRMVERSLVLLSAS